MKKLAATFISVLLVLSLVACGNNNQSEISSNLFHETDHCLFLWLNQNRSTQICFAPCHHSLQNWDKTFSELC